MQFLFCTTCAQDQPVDVPFLDLVQLLDELSEGACSICGTAFFLDPVLTVTVHPASSQAA